jgi:pyruvate dehydrogenase E2 component (dihydrolipoamide acetyltransferase)
LADRKQLDVLSATGSGPGGRIIERDVQAMIAQKPVMSPLAQSMVDSGGYSAPAKGSGVSGRIMAADLAPVSTATTPIQPAAPADDEVEIIPVQGIRKVIANRMLESLQTTAQLTLNSSADARALQAYRQQLKTSSEELGLQTVTINDLLLFAVSRFLPRYPTLNALFTGQEIHQYRVVQLGVAVDTPRGLMVPTIRRANLLSLKQLADESKRLANACLDGKIAPDELAGGTFTVTNLGNLGIESFTPVLNPPQVAILGVGGIYLKPVQVDSEVKFIPHIGLSLTINHQVVDGAPAARFLQALATGLAQFELLLAM